MRVLFEWLYVCALSQAPIFSCLAKGYCSHFGIVNEGYDLSVNLWLEYLADNGEFCFIWISISFPRWILMCAMGLVAESFFSKLCVMSYGISPEFKFIVYDVPLADFDIILEDIQLQIVSCACGEMPAQYEQKYNMDENLPTVLMVMCCLK